MKIADILSSTAAQMMPCEKALLYAFVSALKPE
jgi:hypothetical protein